MREKTKQLQKYKASHFARPEELEKIDLVNTHLFAIHSASNCVKHVKARGTITTGS